MQISTTKEALLPALIQVGSVIESRQTMPILSNYLFRTEQGKMTILATDLEIEISSQITIDAEKEFEFTAPAKKLLDICKALDTGTSIDLRVEGDKLTVIAGRGRYRMSILPADDYPKKEDILPIHSIKISVDVLANIIHKTQFAMALQDVRYYLNGMLFEIGTQNLRTVATDGHRLAMSDGVLTEPADAFFQCIVPRKAIGELAKQLNNGTLGEEVELQFSESYLSLLYDKGSFVSKLIDGRYPNYQQVMPEVHTDTLIAPRENLKHALIRASILTNQKLKAVKFELESNLLTLTAHNQENEESVEELEVEYTGPKLNMGFNIAYLLDVLNVLDDDTVKFNFSTNNTSILIQAPNSEQSRYVVMTMHI